MNTPHTETPEGLQQIYATRFSGQEAYRTQVWKTLTSQFFTRWIKPTDAVLDLGCGYAEFINNVSAGAKFAMDLNPSAQDYVASDVTLLQQDCSQPWPLPEGTLDVVFTSNFFEHLPTKQTLLQTLGEAKRCLKPGGCIIALGPNIRYLSGAYWDFFDHSLSLTELSLAEALVMTGFKVELTRAKFLPYSMSLGSHPPLWTLRVFLRMPLLWKIFGKQFLVVGRKAL
jgi:SAM-dependent methyltransferase